MKLSTFEVPLKCQNCGLETLLRLSLMTEEKPQEELTPARLAYQQQLKTNLAQPELYLTFSLDESDLNKLKESGCPGRHDFRLVIPGKMVAR